MMLRPLACSWFELIALREDLEPLLELLAQAGAIELQTDTHDTQRWVGAGIERALDRFHELARAYRAKWPRAPLEPAGAIVDPDAAFAQALARVEAWRIDADPILDQLERLEQRQRGLADLVRLLETAADLPQPALLAASDGAAVRVFASAPDSAPFDVPAGVLGLRARREREDFVVLVGRHQDLERADRMATEHKARRIALPARLLLASEARRAARLARLSAALGTRVAAVTQELAALDERHQLARALGDLERIEWLAINSCGFAATERLVRVTGWTTARDPATFCGPLRQYARRCVVHFPAPPAGMEPPARLDNPAFVRGFERFARLLGQPGRNEADPSVLLALFAPLLFGFMFGDVGQGMVLCAAGWLLRRRAPLLGLLVPGGVAAIVFGILFGSMFAREDIVHPLWLNPLHDPVAVLATALALGAAILLCGLALNAVQAYWRGRAGLWWSREAGFVFAYAALLAGALYGRLLWFAPVGILWFLLGSYLTARGHRAAALGTGVAQFLEHGLQLFVNTLSFARVGAFALAHAGLSAAVVALADAAGGAGYWIVLVLGNVLILALEGLVVGIQTTRLLLFEFFVRFLEGTGRPFRPLAPPVAATNSSIGESR
jgi:V/A-type H+-transporting ATPase subunit I